MTLRQVDGLITRRKSFLHRYSDGPAQLICSVIAEIQRDPNKRAEPFSPADFEPEDETPAGENDEVAIAAARVKMVEQMKAWTMSFGGRIEIKDN